MRSLYVLTTILLCLFMGACKTLQSGQMLTGQPHGTPSVEHYLDYLDRLQQMDKDDLQQAYRKADKQYAANPDANTRMRLALVLAQPGYQQSDLDAAKSHLLAILNTRPPLPQPLMQFARVELEYVTTVLKQKQRVQEHALKVSNMNHKMSDVEKKLEAMEQEKRELQRKLKEAHDKLRALTDIEEDLSQVTDNPPGN